MRTVDDWIDLDRLEVGLNLPPLMELASALNQRTPCHAPGMPGNRRDRPRLDRREGCWRPPVACRKDSFFQKLFVSLPCSHKANHSPPGNFSPPLAPQAASGMPSRLASPNPRYESRPEHLCPQLHGVSRVSRTSALRDLEPDDGIGRGCPPVFPNWRSNPICHRDHVPGYQAMRTEDLVVDEPEGPILLERFVRHSSQKTIWLEPTKSWSPSPSTSSKRHVCNRF